MCWEDRKDFSMIIAARMKQSDQIRTHCIMSASPFFTCIVFAQHHMYKLLVTNKLEAMGIGRNLSSEKIAQAIISVTVKDISEESSVSARVLYTKM